MRRADVVSGALLIVLGLVGIFVIVPAQTTPARGFGLPPGLLPTVALTVIVVLAAALVVTRLAAVTTPTPGDDPWPLQWRDLAWFLMAATWTLGAVLTIHSVGYLVGAPLLVVGLMLIWGERNPLRIGVTAVFAAGALFVFTRYALRIVLP